MSGGAASPRGRGAVAVCDSLAQVSINLVEIAIPLDEARNAHFNRGVGLEADPGVEFGGVGAGGRHVTGLQRGMSLGRQSSVSAAVVILS